MLCAQHPGSASEEHRDGVRILRQGGRLGVYAATLRRLRALERTEGGFDVVIDTQNGLPFAAPLATRSPVVVLVHHVHREQWPIVFGPVTAKVGWTIESRVAPRFYRGHQYVAVSQETKAELVELGVRTRPTSRSSTTAPTCRSCPCTPRAGDPRLVVLGRLVPHKRVEHAITVLATAPSTSSPVSACTSSGAGGGRTRSARPRSSPVSRPRWTCSGTSTS